MRGGRGRPTSASVALPSGAEGRYRAWRDRRLRCLHPRIEAGRRFPLHGFVHNRVPIQSAHRSWSRHRVGPNTKSRRNRQATGLSACSRRSQPVIWFQLVKFRGHQPSLTPAFVSVRLRLSRPARRLSAEVGLNSRRVGGLQNLQSSRIDEIAEIPTLRLPVVIRP